MASFSSWSKFCLFPHSLHMVSLSLSFFNIRVGRSREICKNNLRSWVLEKTEGTPLSSSQMATYFPNPCLDHHTELVVTFEIGNPGQGVVTYSSTSCLFLHVNPGDVGISASISFITSKDKVTARVSHRLERRSK